MTVEDLIQTLLDAPSSVRERALLFSPEEAERLIDQLKREADRHWWINANRSLQLADLIVQIGQARCDLRQEALGLMARGDALKFLGQIEAAWDLLDQAGTLFQTAGDQVGWARTRIGRLLISVDLNRVRQALEEGELARQIVVQSGSDEILLRLHINTAIVYDLLGDHHHALTLYHDALAISETLGETGKNYLGMLYTNIGYAYNFLGDFRQALAYYERAHQILTERGELGGAAVAELNIAYIAQSQGRYRHALQILHRIQGLLAGQFPAEYASARRVMVECYLALNRYQEARDLARQVASDFESLGADYERACTLGHLATAEAELLNLAAAQSALEISETIFSSLDSAAWKGTIHLRRGRIALQQGDLHRAQREAQLAGGDFASAEQQTNGAFASLLDAQVLLASGKSVAAIHSAQDILHTARHSRVPELAHSAHVLLGQAMEAQGNYRRAKREYYAAAATIERLQRGLTITLRPGFMEDKGEALNALIRLHLREGKTHDALETLERAKSQVMLGYLSNRESLRWPTSDPAAQALVDELNQLRAEHHWHYRIAYEPPTGELSSDLSADQAVQAVQSCERRMRTLTEQLYLQTESTALALAPSLEDMRHHLHDDALLIEFYNDGKHVWAFTLSQHSLNVYPLSITVQSLDQLISQFQFNITCALKVGISPASRQLAPLAKQLAQRLYHALLKPLEVELIGRQHLIMVPYGALHYLPFHLLHNGATYLIEQAEMVVLPTAGLLTHRSPQRSGGARVFAHSWEGKLPQTLVEAQQVNMLFGGELYCDQEAKRGYLQVEPCKLLHLAAHGEHRIDQPDLSYIHLADGQLYTDDLLQNDLSYELVTLSACETGRAKVVAGDELIGLGRGFLYAGAGALVLSLWRVDDLSTVTLMETMYHALHAGASKSGALRDAVLASNLDQHPAFWGAFQLIGDAGPLSAL